MKLVPFFPVLRLLVKFFFCRLLNIVETLLALGKEISTKKVENNAKEISSNFFLFK